MKNLVILTLVICLALLSCKKETTNICGVKDPATELPWLAKIIALAETDTTGNYYGTIYLESYNGENVFWADMMMGSGGLYGHWFNCDGSNIIDKKDIPWPRQNKIIYTNE